MRVSSVRPTHGRFGADGRPDAVASRVIRGRSRVGARCEDVPVPAHPLDRVHRRRLATQRLSSTGLRHGADVVRLLGCVQSQDAPLAAWSLGMRMRPGTTYADVLAEQAAGGWVRTHVLRPTWHLLAPEDLRWMQRVTGPRVESGMAGVNRRLGLTAEVVTAALGCSSRCSPGPTPRTRREVRVAFDAAGLPTAVQHLAHLLIIAEVRAVICSGPPRGTEHTYVLVDEVVPPGPSDDLADDDARRELTRRFISGHGPASERDLARWSTLTLSRSAAPWPTSTGVLERVEVDGHELWFDPQVPARTTHEHARLPAADLRRGVPDLRRTPGSHGATPMPPGNGCSPRPAAASSSCVGRTSASGSGWSRPRTCGSPCGPTCRWAVTTRTTSVRRRRAWPTSSSARWTCLVPSTAQHEGRRSPARGRRPSAF